jgi:phosphoribosylformimino-5-aminoimidazole carboxamide ribotide isomerase
VPGVIVYPAIDIRGGRCVRLRQGDFAAETVYDDDPVAVAERMQQAGAEWLHVVDLDAARRDGDNRAVIESIAAKVPVPVQVGGGVRDAGLLARGVARIVVGSLAVEDPAAVEEMMAAHPDQVALAVDHRAGQVQVRGWLEGGGVRVDELVGRFPGAAAAIVTDIQRDGMLSGPDLEGLSRLAAAVAVPVIASGGVSEAADIAALAETGVAGVIVGKALYEGRLTVEEAMAACGP